MKPQIESGHCSACLGPLERGRSGVWWHTGTPCGRGPARFVLGPAPDESPTPDEGAGRQQQSPRDRQIRDPGRNR